MNKKYIASIAIIIALLGGATYFWFPTTREGTEKIATLPDNIVKFYADPYLKSFAYKARTQEGFSIVYNGEAGKTYGEIESFIFSLDGRNYAYIAKESSTDEQESVVVNEKEGKRYNKKISELNADADGNFSYYVGGYSKEDNKIQVINTRSGVLPIVIKTLKLPWRSGFQEDESYLGDQFFNYTKSPNRKSFAYQVRENGKRRVVYVDENGIEHKGANYLDTLSFTWSPKGNHFAYSAYAENGKSYIVVDGIEQGPYEDFYRYLFTWNPGENAFAYRLDSDTAGKIVVLNGKEVGRFGIYDYVSDLVISPNGEYVIYSVYRPNEGGSDVFINEVKSPMRYDYFSGFVYSPDSKTIAYAIQEDDTVAIMKGNEEIGRYQTKTKVDYSKKFPILFSKDWGDFAYPIVRVSTTTKQEIVNGISTTASDTIQGFSVSINGQESPTYGVVYLTENSFSEDGKIFTYLAISNKQEVFRVSVSVDRLRTKSR